MQRTRFEVFGPYTVGGTSERGLFEEALLTRESDGWHAHPANAERWFTPEPNADTVLKHPDFRRTTNRQLDDQRSRKAVRELSDLRDRRGVYVFTLQTQRRSTRPLYVGMTRAPRRGFMLEAFTQRTLRLLKDGLNEQKVRNGTVFVYFLPDPPRGKIASKRIQGLETFLIAQFHHHGPNLLNRKKRPGQTPETYWVIAGWPLPWNVERGRRSDGVKDLMRMAPKQR